MSARIFKTLSVLVMAAVVGNAFGESPAKGAKPVWARSGQALELDCHGAAPGTAESTHGDASVSFECVSGDPRRNDKLADDWLRVRYKNKSGADLQAAVALKDLNGGFWRPQEILWSPDGLAFLINGSENAYAGSDFFEFRVEGNTLVRKSITRVAQTDMVDRLAKCWPYIRDIVGLEPAFNMSAVSWTEGSIAVVAEVPCTSSYENSMCSVYGYELDPQSGNILKVLSADEVRRNWRLHMSWKLSQSDLPACDPNTGKVQ